MEQKIKVNKIGVQAFFTNEGVARQATLLLGKELKLAEIFKEGDLLTLSGISKGKGFAGVVKRHGFKGGPRTHGQSDRERAPGSIGSTTTPGRVRKGKRMAGKMGGNKVTLKNLVILKTDPDKNILYIQGSVPGRKGGIITILKISKA